MLEMIHDLLIFDSKSKLRNNEIVVGAQYKGSKTSRKDLYDEDEEMGSESEEEMHSGSGSEEESGSEQEEELDDSELEEEEEDENEEAEDVETMDVETMDDSKRDKLKELLNKEQKTLASQMSTTAQTDAQKGESIQNQMVIYESILDARIKLQKGLSAGNSMPLSKEKAEPFTGENTNKRIKSLKSSLYDLLGKLAEVRVNMLKADGINTDSININGKRTLESAVENAQQLESVLTPYRDAVLTKWSRKIQAASGASALNQSKFSIQNQDAKLQVSTNLADMDRLVKRTRVNRSNYVVLGEEDKTESSKKNVDSNLQEREEIFDDTDFYRILLKDLVDRRMADSSTGGGMKWTVVKPKVKKNVDTKASKGRKLRYHVQEKIQNFDAPRQYIQWGDDQIDELFAGLFGQKVAVDEDEEVSEPEEEVVSNDGLKIFG